MNFDNFFRGVDDSSMAFLVVAPFLIGSRSRAPLVSPSSSEEVASSSSDSSAVLLEVLSSVCCSSSFAAALLCSCPRVVLTTVEVAPEEDERFARSIPASVVLPSSEDSFSLSLFLSSSLTTSGFPCFKTALLLVVLLVRTLLCSPFLFFSTKIA